MKRFIVPTLVFLSGASLFLAKAQQKQPPNWKGKIELWEGVETVVNPDRPLYGPLKLDLQEDLRIGREDDKNFQFWFLNGVQVDDEDNIYVSDARNFRIQVFDRNGRFVRTMGRQGQGPGEFQQISLLRVHGPSGRLYVRDIPARKIVILDLQGKYVGGVPTKEVVLDFFPLDDGGSVAAVSVFSESDLKTIHDIVRMDAKGEIVSRQGGFLSNPFTERVSGGGISGVHTGFELEIHLARLGGNRFAYGFSERYDWTIVDKDLRPLRRIVKDARPPSFTEEEKAGFKRIPVPRAKPYFFRALGDSEGRLYVQRNFTKNKSTVQDDIPMEVDVFSPEGYFIYTTALPPNTHVIRDGYLYSFSVDFEEGQESVIRYKIKNWGQMK